MWIFKNTSLNTSKAFVRGKAASGCEIYYPVPMSIVNSENHILILQDTLQKQLDNQFK